jgi:hypothetical protein
MAMREDAQMHGQYMKEREQDTKDMAISNDGAVIQDGETSIITTKVERIKGLVSSIFKSKSDVAVAEVEKNKTSI